jgi:hypothetical protein
MTTFGLGYGKDKFLDKGRPCIRPASASIENLKNSWFQCDGEGNQFEDARPKWWSELEVTRGARPSSVSRDGEWKLVWQPKKATPDLSGKSTSAYIQKPQTASSGVRRNWGPGSGPKVLSKTRGVYDLRASTRAETKPPYPDGMTGMLTTGALSMGIPGLIPPNRAAAKTRGPASSVKGSARSKLQAGRISTSNSEERAAIRPALSGNPVTKLRLPLVKPDVENFGSEAASSARSRLSTVSRRLGTRNSMRSQRSMSSLGSRLSSSYSAYSGLTSVSQQDEILQRIKGLEDALNAERALRQQMQELIESKVPATIQERSETQNDTMHRFGYQ